MGWGCPGCGMGGFGGNLGFLGMLPGLLMSGEFLILIIFGIIWLTRQVRSARVSTGIHTDQINPMKIAQRRLAAGEITMDEYEEIRRKIES